MLCWRFKRCIISEAIYHLLSLPIMIIIIDILHGLPDLGFSGFLPPVWRANFYPSPFRGNEFGLPKCKIGNCFHIFSIYQDGICSFYKGLLVTVIRISSEFCHFHATVNQNRKISSAGAFPQIFGPYNISENITLWCLWWRNWWRCDYRSVQLYTIDNQSQ